MAIRLSNKHGVNPTVGVCMYCGREDGTIGLMGQLPGDREADGYSIISDEPCDECKGYMEQGIMLCEVVGTYTIKLRNRRTKERPRPTGTLCVVSEDFIKRVIQPDELRDQILEKRMAFVTPEDWEAIGLPRENIDNRPNQGESG